MKNVIRMIAFFMVLALFTGCSNLKAGENEHKIKLDNQNFTPGNSMGLPENAPFSSPLEKTLMEQAAIKQANIVLYFHDKASNKLISETRQVILLQGEDLPKKAIEELISGPKSEVLDSVLPKETTIIKVEQAENILTVNLSSDFLRAENLLVARMALVNTLTELEGIKYVKIYIDGQELTSNGREDGTVLGLLTRYPVDVQEVLDAESKQTLVSEIREMDRELYFRDSQGLYLIPEVRTIFVKNNQIARAIVEELIKGPLNTKEGLYPTIPKEIQLMDIVLVEGQENNQADGLNLYFSKEFKEYYPKGSSGELTTLGSIVYSLTDLPNVGWVKFFYQDEDGQYIDAPLGNMDISVPLKREDFGSILGRKLKIYFSDKNGMNLVPEYRAMSRENTAVAKKIISELLMGPMETDHVEVLPYNLSINVRVEGDTAIVDLPEKFNGNQLGSRGEIMALYAIVNSLTDPVNTKNINKVQFLVGGQKVESFGNMSLMDPFVRNPALISE